ncbi:hypothetical protein GQ44DRAFT_658163 [Phaeosphaeriaceae sp. PMI808]|nr:hypothetical protein GQ44DRAFT_658163 [Phaeosphaeriaceae sp. PMI808]
MGVLSNLVIAVDGTLPAEPTTIRKWVTANGGRYSSKVEDHVTHLVVGKDAWKKVTDSVMRAAELNIFIVSYDWLEDSLQRKRKLAEKKYTWDMIKKDTKRKKDLKKLGVVADGKKFLDGCRRIKELTGSDLYHYYLDPTGFEYKITLARTNFALNNITHYQLSILESHATPHTYCTFVQYTPAGNITNAPLLHDNKATKTQASPTIPTNHAQNINDHSSSPAPFPPPQEDPNAQHPEAERLRSLITPISPSSTAPYKTLICPMNSPFTHAWRAFRHAFRDLTLLSWEERFDANKAVQTTRASALSIEPFIYSKPPIGLPIGLLVQESGLHQNYLGGQAIAGDAENGYVRNEFGLPGLDEPLGLQGFIGLAIHREGERRKRDEDARVKIKEEEGRRVGGEVRKKGKAEYNKPLFHSVTGRPRSEYGSGEGGNASGVRSVWANGRAGSTKGHGRWGYDE